MANRAGPREPGGDTRKSIPAHHVSAPSETNLVLSYAAIAAQVIITDHVHVHGT